MGNSASKKARQEQLAAAERNYAEASSELAARDQELARSQRGLEVSKAQEDRLANEAEALRKKYAELDGLSKALEQEREKHIAQLQGDLQVKGDETVAQRRVVDSRTRERDDARKQMTQMEEQLKSIQEQTQLSAAEFEQRRKELESTADARAQELQKVKADSASLAEKVKLLEEKHEVLTVEFEAAKATADEKLAAAKNAADQEISSAKAQAADELTIAKASMSESARSLTSVSSELASTKTALSATTSRLQEMQKTHNESVSKRAASYEAFTATKQELADTQQRYLTLYKEHEKQGQDLKQLSTEHASTKAALAKEREGKEALVAEVAALRKKLVDLESRKRMSDVQVQEVRLGGDVAATA